MTEPDVVEKHVDVNRTIALLVAPEGVEQVELTGPWGALKGAGMTPRLVSTRAGEVQAFNHLVNGDAFPTDDVVSDLSASDFDALVLPGGVANPDYLRTQPDAVSFVAESFQLGRPVAVICHGANWVDEEVAICNSGSNTLISSRMPDDLETFNRVLVSLLGDPGSG